jgi:ferritin
MRMANNVLEAINEQVNNELDASHSYLSMSAVCERMDFPGAGRWFLLQSDEERMHALKLFDYLNKRDFTIVLAKIDKPNHARAGKLIAVFEAALEQEMSVSRQIDSLYELAYKNRDFASVVELQWFLTEQVEEEKSVRDIVAQLKLVGNDPAGLLAIDRQLGARTPAPPVSRRGSVEHAPARQRPPPQLHLADDVALRHEPPVAAVGAVVPVVAHHEVVAFLHHLRAPVVVPAVLGRHVVVLERDVLHVHSPVHDLYLLALFRDHPLDERLVRVDRVVEHHDVASARVAQSIDELVDDQPVLVFERGRHALAFDTRHLEAERHDERRVNGSGRQRLEPGEDLFPHPIPRHHGRRGALNGGRNRGLGPDRRRRGERRVHGRGRVVDVERQIA